MPEETSWSIAWRRRLGFGDFVRWTRRHSKRGASATIRREGALPERDQGHRLSEDVRHGGAVRPGGAVRVRRVGALAEESRKSSSRFVATWGSCSSRWWTSSPTSRWWTSSSTSRWWRSSSLSRWWRRCLSSPRSGCCADAAPLHILHGFKQGSRSVLCIYFE